MVSLFLASGTMNLLLTLLCLNIPHCLGRFLGWALHSTVYSVQAGPAGCFIPSGQQRVEDREECREERS